MAKKKKSESAANAGSKSSTSKKLDTKKTAKPKTKKVQRPLCEDEIGNVAGDVWQLLHSESDLTLSNIKKQIKVPEPLIMSAVGWLAREGKLEFESTGRATKISLR